jgi:short-subunit dehydrogenase
VSGPLSGRVSIVTGASSGIGAATARELARRGARVVIAARRATELDALGHSISAAGGVAMAVPTDLTDPSQVERLHTTAVASLGRVDVLVNCAGANWSTAFERTAPEDVQRLVNVNLVAAMLLTRAVLPGMLERRQGAVVSVGSLSGRVAMEPLYSATKYGLRGFSLALRRQLEGTGVSVSLVSPGKIRTPMTSDHHGRLPEPELVAAAIADLVERPKREIVIPRRHYAIAWLEQGSPALADAAYRWRRWSPVLEAQKKSWNS